MKCAKAKLAVLSFVEIMPVSSIKVVSCLFSITLHFSVKGMVGAQYPTN